MLMEDVTVINPAILNQNVAIRGIDFHSLGLWFPFYNSSSKLHL